MQCTLNSIEKYCGTTKAGLLTIKLIIPDDVLSAGISQTGPSIIGDIELKPGTQSYDIRFDRQTASFIESGNITNRSGDLYTRTLSFQLIHDRYDVANLIQKLKNKRVHALITDRNGYTRFSRDMRLAHETNTGASFNSKSGNTFTFTGAGTEKVKFLTGSLIEDSTPPDPWILRSIGGINYEMKINSNGALVTVSTATTGVLTYAVDNWDLTISENGELITKTGTIDTDNINLTAPDGVTYHLSIGTAGELITSPTSGIDSGLPPSPE